MAQCTVCGADLPEEAQWCPRCGAPVQGQVQAPGGRGMRGMAGPAALRDILRDAIAACLLFVSLFPVWVSDTGLSHTLPGTAAAHIDVLLVTVVTAAGLAVPHLGRAGVFGAPWSARRVRRARLLAALPYAVLVLVYLVLALVAQLTLGPAMALGMAGAILAAQPRQRELPPEGRLGLPWMLGTVVVSGLAVLFTLVQIAEMFAIFSANGPAAFILSIILGLSASVVLLIAAGGILTRHRAWRRIGVGMGVLAAVLVLFALNPQVVVVNATLHGPAPTFSLMFWIAFGAAASAPALDRRLPPVSDPAAGWLALVRASLGLAVCGGILLIAVAAIELLYQQSAGPAPAAATAEWTIALAVGVLMTAGAVTAWAIGRTETRAAVQAIGVFAGILVVLGLILLTVWSLPGALPFAGAGTLAPLVAFGFPPALLGSLWLPAASRARYAALPRAAAPGRPAQHPEPATRAEPAAEDGPAAGRAAGDAAGPDTATAAAPAETDGAGISRAETSETETGDDGGAGAGEAETAEHRRARLIAEAGDPATPATRLHELAAVAPFARPALARNPATYPALVAWLGRLGDPDIDAALADRAAQPEAGDHTPAS